MRKAITIVEQTTTSVLVDTRRIRHRILLNVAIAHRAKGGRAAVIHIMVREVTADGYARVVSVGAVNERIIRLQTLLSNYQFPQERKHPPARSRKTGSGQLSLENITSINEKLDAIIAMLRGLL